jgi:ABC-type sugar transport system permease subunit
MNTTVSPMRDQYVPPPLGWQRRVARYLGRDWLLGYGLLLPVLLVMIGLVAYPFIYSFWLSMQQKQLGGEATFVFLDNFIYLLGNDDFQQAAINSFIYTIAGVGLKFLLGLAMALVLNSAIKVRNFWRALLFIPWSIPIVVTAFTWRWMYDDLNGVFNTVLARLGLIDRYIFWLGNPDIALWAVIVAMIWQGTPFYCMNFLAGLQSIPRELYDAAKIDGANRVQEFWHITIPGLFSVILITLLLSTIWTANEMQFVYILTQGGPLNATQIYPHYAYEMSIKLRQLGLGAAIPLMFFPFLVAIIIVLTRRLLKQE